MEDRCKVRLNHPPPRLVFHYIPHHQQMNGSIDQKWSAEGKQTCRQTRWGGGMWVKPSYCTNTYSMTYISLMWGDLTQKWHMIPDTDSLINGSKHRTSSTVCMILFPLQWWCPLVIIISCSVWTHIFPVHWLFDAQQLSLLTSTDCGAMKHHTLTDTQHYNLLQQTSVSHSTHTKSM